MWSTANSENWHALFVFTGHEDKICHALQKNIGDGIQFIVPKRELRERKAGRWHLMQRTLFPGYILLQGEITVDTYYRIKAIPVLTSLLKDEDGPLLITAQELTVLNKLICGGAGHVGVSTAYLVNEKVRITAGPLLGLEGLIQSIDARKGRAKVKINFLGETRIIQLGIDIINKTETACNKTAYNETFHNESVREDLSLGET